MGKNQTMRENANVFAEMLTTANIDNSRHDNSKYAEYCNIVYVGKHKLLCWNHSNDVTLCYDKYIASLVDSTTASQCVEYDNNGKQFIVYSTDASQKHIDTLATAVATISCILEEEAKKAKAEEKAKKEADNSRSRQQQRSRQRQQRKQ